MALHKRFDEVVDAAEEYMDLLADRIVQLGGTAEGMIQVATTRTGLEAYPLTLAEERRGVPCSLSRWESASRFSSASPSSCISGSSDRDK